MNVLSGAVSDIGENRNINATILTIVEHPDIITPRILSAEVDYNVGVLIIRASETIDSTPKSLVNVSLIHIANDSSNTGGGDYVVLEGTTVTAYDDVVFTILLTEKQRAYAISHSGTQGGDKVAITIEVLPGAVKDIGTNPCGSFYNIPVSETADTTRPLILRSVLNLSTGLLEIIVNETIDTTPKDLVNPSKVVLYNSSNGANVRLANAVIKPQDEVSVFITLTEKQRVEAIALSSTNGGDTTALTLSVEAGAMQDIGTNKNNRFDGIFVTEVADTVRPLVKAVLLNLSTGILKVGFSETIDTTPTALVLLEIMFITEEENSSTGKDPIKLAGANVTSLDDPEGKTVVIQLTEAQRVKSIEYSKFKIFSQI